MEVNVCIFFSTRFLSWILKFYDLKVKKVLKAQIAFSNWPLKDVKINKLNINKIIIKNALIKSLSVTFSKHVQSARSWFILIYCCLKGL